MERFKVVEDEYFALTAGCGLRTIEKSDELTISQRRLRDKVKSMLNSPIIKTLLGLRDLIDLDLGDEDKE